MSIDVTVVFEQLEVFSVPMDTTGQLPYNATVSDEQNAENEEKYCVICGALIPPRRLAALPGTTTCVRCATVPRRTRSDLRGDHFVQHTGGLHEKYLHEEDAEMDRKRRESGEE